MKPLLFNAINPFTGTAFTYDDPNLRWGSPSYYLEPGDPGFVPYPGQVIPPPAKPKKKPFRRIKRPKTEPQPILHTTMSTFKFTISPKSSGGFTTRVVLGDQIHEPTLTEEIATAAGVTPLQATTVIKTLFAKLRECSNGCAWSPELFGELSVRPTSGGSEPGPADFQNAGEINANIALSFTAEVITTWQGGLVLESQGTKGLVTPVIDTVICLQNNEEDHYVVGDNIRLVGHDLRFDKADLNQGVFFIKADGSEIRATVYGPINPSDVTALVPAGLTGAVQVRISAFINGSLRNYLYTRQLS